MTHRTLITGATGFVGSHVAEACARRGWPVVALVRPGRDTTPLAKLGATVVPGDVTDPDAVRKAVAQADRVVHCAAKVGDWGPVGDYRAVNVEGLRHLLEAAKESRVARFVHVSSLGVYEARHHHGTDEKVAPPARHIDGYTQTKVEAERLALEYYREHGVPVCVLRPGFVYGPRDRMVFPKLVAALRDRQMRWIDGGRHVLNSTYVGNFAAAVLLALEDPVAVGQTYNITDARCVTRREMFEAIAEGLNLPLPTIDRPLAAARLTAAVSEGVARLLGMTKPPAVTRARVKFLGLNLDFSIEKARRELGYAPHVDFEEGIRETINWWKAEAP